MTVTINDLGKDVKITSSKQGLNLIACLAWDAAEKNSFYGNKSISKSYERIAEQIHNALDDVGYFDCIK